MARAILVEGMSGTGKSTAWRNIPSTEAIILTPNGKRLPFQGATAKYTPFDPTTGKGNVITTPNLVDISVYLKNISAGAPHIKYVLIDDFTHYFNARIMSKAFIADNGFAKWNKFGADVFGAFLEILPLLREDLTVVVNHHTSRNDEGRHTFKSSGKLLENTIDPVSYFTYVFHTQVLRKDTTVDYMFITNDDGIHEAKTPMGCFEDLYIDNDMYAALQQIEKYELGE